MKKIHDLIKFNIKNKELNSGDDYGMLKEVFERRFSKIIKNKKERG